MDNFLSRIIRRSNDGMKTIRPRSIGWFEPVKPISQFEAGLGLNNKQIRANKYLISFPIENPYNDESLQAKQHRKKSVKTDRQLKNTAFELEQEKIFRNINEPRTLEKSDILSQRISLESSLPFSKLTEEQKTSQIVTNKFNLNSNKKIDKTATTKKSFNRTQTREIGFDKTIKNPSSLSGDSKNVLPSNQKKFQEAVKAKLVRPRDKAKGSIQSPGDRLDSGRDTLGKITKSRLDSYFLPPHDDTATHHSLSTPEESNSGFKPIKPVIELPKKNFPTTLPRVSESSKQPKLVIGQLRVEVVQEEVKAPPKNPIRNVKPPASSTRHHGGKIRSKLRFGLGQM
jgi:hypothetical protein